VAVIGGVVFARLRGVVRSVVKVALRYVCMVSGLFMIALFMVLRGFLVMAGGAVVVLRSFPVVLGDFFRHVKLSLRRKKRMPPVFGRLAAKPILGL
jgi:hypothetical protein